MTYKLTLVTGINPNEPTDFSSAVGSAHVVPTLNNRFVLHVHPINENLGAKYVTTGYIVNITHNTNGSYSFTDATNATYLLEVV